MPILIYEDLHACLGQMRVFDRTIVWDDSDKPSIISSLTSFQMPDIKRFTGFGFPRAHLRLYSLVMRALGRDDG